MRTFLFTVVTALFIISTNHAQIKEITVTGTFIPKDKSAAYISVLGNTNQKPLLVQAKVTDGVFSMQLPINLPLGVYKLGFAMEQKPTFYFVHDGKSNYHLDFVSTNNKWGFTSKTGTSHKYLTNYWQKKDSLMKPIGVLYFFAQNYPHKKEAIYKKNREVLHKKVKDFKSFRANVIAKAGLFSKEILMHTQTVFYEPQWDTKAIETKYLNTIWEQIPKNDSVFYNKPFFIGKLQATFDGLLEDKNKTESEKYQAIKERLTWLLEKLSKHIDKNKYNNLCLRYFGSKGYPYVLSDIDAYLNKTQLLTSQDKEGFVYREKQELLIGKKAPSIKLTTAANFLETVAAEKKVLVFVGGNTPFSFQLLESLKKEAATKENTKVVAILLTDNKESIQNFKSLHPTWAVFAPNKTNINNVIEAYKLVYAPSVFVLDKDNTILKQVAPFESLQKAFSGL